MSARCYALWGFTAGGGPNGVPCLERDIGSGSGSGSGGGCGVVVMFMLWHVKGMLEVNASWCGQMARGL